jgi:DNA primase
MISEKTINAVLDAAIIEEVIGEFTSIKKKGVNYTGSCPFHNEKTASFTVSPAKQIYKCFGCGKAGGVITFLMENQAMAYPEAIKFLANKYHIEVEETLAPSSDGATKEIQQRKESAIAFIHWAEDYFINKLKSSAAATQYLTINRSYEEKTLQEFNIGFAGSDNKFIPDAGRAGYKIQALYDSGLVRLEEGKKIEDITEIPGNCYFTYANRIMVPVKNAAGQTITFAGRIIGESKTQAKWINGPETILYSKSKTLFGLSAARRDISREGHAILVEGYGDVMHLHQAGVHNAVGSCGTSITPEQLKLLARYTQRLILMADGDAAGQKAIEKTLPLAVEAGFAARVCPLPEAMDPEDYILAPEAEKGEG